MSGNGLKVGLGGEAIGDAILLNEADQSVEHVEIRKLSSDALQVKLK